VPPSLPVVTLAGLAADVRAQVDGGTAWGSQDHDPRVLIRGAFQPRTNLYVGLALPTLPAEPFVEGVTTGRQDPKVVAQPDHIVRSAEPPRCDPRLWTDP
jgi:hypothetical protein